MKHPVNSLHDIPRIMVAQMILIIYYPLHIIMQAQELLSCFHFKLVSDLRCPKPMHICLSMGYSIKESKCISFILLGIDPLIPKGHPLHSFPSKLVQIPYCPRHFWHTNSNQTQQNSCQTWIPTLRPTTVHNKNKKGFSVPYIK